MGSFRNATTRLVATHLGLVLLATGLILAGIYWRAGGVIDAEQRAVIESELRALGDAYSSGGRPALAWAIERRLEDGGERTAVFLLADAAGARVAGNLAAWPPTVVPGSGWVTLDLYRLDMKGPTAISALTVALPDGERLLVGRDVAARAAFDRTLWRALMAALVAMAALSLLTGWLLSRLVLGRIDAISADAGAIVAAAGPGTLDRRIARTGSGDEFDRLADTLNAMLDRIGLLVRDLRSLTDGLAHDLRRPVGRLVRQIEAIRAPSLNEAGREARIEAALAEADSLLAMSTALIGISRAEAGIGIEQFGPVDLARLAADVAELFEAVAEDRGLRLTLALPPGPAPTFSGHDQLLAQALSNLVENALRHAPEGSPVTLGLGPGPCLWVADHGAGIPPEAREAVKERFVRLDPSRGSDGSGLGLALVAAVARLHGAAFTLSDNPDSTPGPGLRAELRFE